MERLSEYKNITRHDRFGAGLVWTECMYTWRKCVCVCGTSVCNANTHTHMARIRDMVLRAKTQGMYACMQRWVCNTHPQDGDQHLRGSYTCHGQTHGHECVQIQSAFAYLCVCVYIYIYIYTRLHGGIRLLHTHTSLHIKHAIICYIHTHRFISNMQSFVTYTHIASNQTCLHAYTSRYSMHACAHDLLPVFPPEMSSKSPPQSANVGLIRNHIV